MLLQILNNDSANAYAANGLGMVLAEKGLLDQVHLSHTLYTILIHYHRVRSSTTLQHASV
jgi:hypothetical protein